MTVITAHDFWDSEEGGSGGGQRHPDEVVGRSRRWRVLSLAGAAALACSGCALLFRSHPGSHSGNDVQLSTTGGEAVRLAIETGHDARRFVGLQGIDPEADKAAEQKWVKEHPDDEAKVLQISGDLWGAGDAEKRAQSEQQKKQDAAAVAVSRAVAKQKEEMKEYIAAAAAQAAANAIAGQQQQDTQTTAPSSDIRKSMEDYVASAASQAASSVMAEQKKEEMKAVAAAKAAEERKMAMEQFVQTAAEKAAAQAVAEQSTRDIARITAEKEEATKNAKSAKANASQKAAEDENFRKGLELEWNTWQQGAEERFKYAEQVAKKQEEEMSRAQVAQAAQQKDKQEQEKIKVT